MRVFAVRLFELAPQLLRFYVMADSVHFFRGRCRMACWSEVTHRCAPLFPPSPFSFTDHLHFFHSRVVKDKLPLEYFGTLFPQIS